MQALTYPSTTEPMLTALPCHDGDEPVPGLIVDTPHRQPYLVPLLAWRTVVGSGVTCDLRVPGRFVSRCHCAFVIGDSGLYVEDLDSSNGTEVDGRRTPRTRLSTGALVHLGDVSLTVVALEPPPPGRRPAPLVCRFEDMVGVHPETIARFHRLNKVAATDAPVLLLGPSGVGKELHAQALHGRSRRAGGTFQPVNCGALPPSLAEAQLFGARRGAFTGADRDIPGHFELADGGTLFLDEIGELPVEVQPKLLRTLESGEIQPLGAPRPRRVDVRIVAATNRQLRREVDAGRFRQDLLYRLDGVTVDVPPLSARPEDVASIARAVLARLSPPRRMTTAAAVWLTEQTWVGNVRELQHLLRAAAALTRNPQLDAADLCAARTGVGSSPAPIDDIGDGPKAFLDRAIVAVLREHAGSRKEAIRRLGIPRSTFFARLKRLRLSGELANVP